MKIKIKNILLLIPLSIYLLACASSDVKTKDTNLFQAMANNASGESERQLNAKKVKEAQSRKDLSLALKENEELKLNLQSVKVEKRKIDASLVSLQQKNAEIEQEIAKKETLNSEQEAIKKQRLAKIRKIKRSINRLKKIKHKIPPKQYNAQVIALQKEVKILRRVMANQ